MPGTWTQLRSAPAHGVGLTLLLTDGRVMAFEPEGEGRCSALVPDAHGDYVNGSWQPLAPMAHTRRYFGAAVLADGRVIVTGGEYGTGTRARKSTTRSSIAGRRRPRHPGRISATNPVAC